MGEKKIRERLSISLFVDGDIIERAIVLAKQMLAIATNTTEDKIKEADAIRYIFRSFYTIQEQNAAGKTGK